MAFSEESGNGMVMPVAPMYGGNGYNNCFGGDGSWWILLLFILLGGWGNGFGNGYNGGTGYVDNTVQRGFDQSAVMGGLTGINSAVTSGFGDVATALCGGFAGVNAAITNGFAQAEIANNARAMSDMQQMFSLQSQLAQCCCDNRLATCQTQNLVQNEGNQTRAAIQAQTQAILDQMCNDKIDSKNEKIVELQNAINMATMQASQVAQTAEILSKLPAATTASA